MAYYSGQDKKDFLLKDMKNAIGQGMGNAFSKAVDVALTIPMKTMGETIKNITELRDTFFASNQKAIQQAYDNWLKENEDDIDESLMIVKENQARPL